MSSSTIRNNTFAEVKDEIVIGWYLGDAAKYQGDADTLVVVTPANSPMTIGMGYPQSGLSE